LDGDPPTWSEYREQSDERIKVDQWTPKTAGESTLPPEKEEEALRDNTLQSFLSDDDDTANGVIGVGALAAISAKCGSFATAYARRGIRAMVYDPEGNDITTRRGKKRAATGIIGIFVGLVLMHAVGYSAVEGGAVLLVSSLLAKYQSDFDEPPTLPLSKIV
jgi:hypothetical protein